MAGGAEPGSLAGRRVTVTGGGGFVGRHVVAALRRAGVWTPFVPRRADYDLTHPDPVARMYADGQPEIVIHLAARVGGIAANQRSPGSFVHDNLMMGALVLDGARRAGVDRFVAVGTVCAYPAAPPTPFREDDLWAGLPEPTNAPYGLAKRLLLTQCQAYRAEYGLDAVYVIPTNLYGPGDHFDLETSHVIPALIRKMVDAQESGADEVICWGDGTPTRDFLHVADAADAIVEAATAPLGAAPVNLGSGTEVSIKVLAEAIAEATGYGGRIVWDDSRPGGQRRRVLDVTRARDLLGFEARRTLDEGLRQTVAWYREHRPA